MKTFSSNEAKEKFGELVERALQGPVSIVLHGRPSVVMTSAADYRELLALKYERLKEEVVKGFSDFGEGACGCTVDEVAERVLKRNRQH